MQNLGTVNGVRVLSAARVPWKDDDDAIVRGRCEGRGLVLFDGGGKSDAVVIGGYAVIWERQGERFRAFELPRRSCVDELRALSSLLRGYASDCVADDRETGALLVNMCGLVNTHIALKEMVR